MDDGEGRPVLTGLLALVGVAVAVGLILGLVALVGTKVLGLDGGSSSRRPPPSTRCTCPGRRRRRRRPGPLITLAPGRRSRRRPEQPAGQEADQEEDRRSTQISLSAGETSVAPDAADRPHRRLPGGEGAILQVQRFTSGGLEGLPGHRAR